jgi:ribosomal protein S6--L-glutamate ligase
MRDIACDVIDPLHCQLVIDGKRTRILYKGIRLPHYDAVLPRIGASITRYGLAVVRQFEALGMRVLNPSRAISDSRDKFRALQVLGEAGLHVPASVLSRSQSGLPQAIEAVRGFPVVLKMLQGTQGSGVMLLDTPISLESVMETLQGLDQDVIIQQFIAESSGNDYRAFVVGDRIAAAMMRKAAPGEFRANIHRGGQGSTIKLPPTFAKAAIRAARVLGLDVAGIDLIASRRGPLILEANSSPGFEGIEKATGLNLAGAIVDRMSQVASGSRTTSEQISAKSSPRTSRIHSRNS